jgi:hypothetical protein
MVKSQYQAKKESGIYQEIFSKKNTPYRYGVEKS